VWELQIKHISYLEIVRHRLLLAWECDRILHEHMAHFFFLKRNTWHIGTRCSYNSELDILPDRSPAPGCTALATTDVCKTPQLHPAQSTLAAHESAGRDWQTIPDDRNRTPKNEQPVVSNSSYILQSDCSQAYRQTVHSTLKNKLPSWHTRNHWAQRFSCKQQKDEGKELYMSWKQVEQFLNIPKKTRNLQIQEHKLLQGFIVNEVISTDDSIY
jgi:hypothetical protein